MNAELKQRIAFTLVALFLYRVGCHIPLPGIDVALWQNQIGQAGLLFGGGVARLSLLALGIVPYFTAALFVQVAILMSRRIRALAERGESGRQTIERITLLLTAILAAFQAYGIASAMLDIRGLVAWSSASFQVSVVFSLMAGALLLAWLSARITERGIGNGVAWLLFATAVLEIPSAVAGAAESVRVGILSPRGAFLLGLLVVALVAFVVTVELARRNFVVERVGDAGRATMSVKLNPAGIAPQVFALWLMLVPFGIALIWQYAGPAQAGTVAALFDSRAPLYLALHALCLVIASLVYTAFLWDPTRIAARLEAQGLRLASIPAGEPTADAIDRGVSRLALAGALYLVLLIVGTQVFFASLQLPFVIGGFALLVVVGTVLDIKVQLEASLTGGERQ